MLKQWGIRARAVGMCCVAIAVSGVASAAPTAEAWYVTGSLGLVTQADQKLSYTQPGLAPAVVGSGDTLPLDSGFLAGGAIGHYLSEAWRLELEFMYQSVNHPAFNVGSGGPSGDGNFASTTVALNALREFDLFGSPRARSYVGLGGVYLTEVDLDFEGTAVERSFSGSGLGLQALMGARYSLGQRAFVDAGLRYLLTSRQGLDDENGGGGRIRIGYEPFAATLSFGLRF